MRSPEPSGAPAKQSRHCCSSTCPTCSTSCSDSSVCASTNRQASTRQPNTGRREWKPAGPDGAQRDTSRPGVWASGFAECYTVANKTMKMPQVAEQMYRATQERDAGHAPSSPRPDAGDRDHTQAGRPGRDRLRHARARTRACRPRDAPKPRLLVASSRLVDWPAKGLVQGHRQRMRIEPSFGDRITLSARCGRSSIKGVAKPITRCHPLSPAADPDEPGHRGSGASAGRGADHAADGLATHRPSFGTSRVNVNDGGAGGRSTKLSPGAASTNWRPPPGPAALRSGFR